VTDGAEPVAFQSIGENLYEFATQAGHAYTITAVEPVPLVEAPEEPSTRPGPGGGR
jgi:hypothetical protein